MNHEEPEGFNMTEFVEFESDETESRCESDADICEYTDCDTDSSDEICTNRCSIRFAKIRSKTNYRTILTTENDFLPE